MLQDTFRDRMLLQRYLEPITLKYDISAAEARLMLYLNQAKEIGTRRELAELTNLSRTSLSLTLKKLVSRDLISMEEIKNPKTKEKQIALEFLPESSRLLADLVQAEKDCEHVRLSGFTPEELKEYQVLSDKIKANIQNVLQA